MVKKLKMNTHLEVVCEDAWKKGVKIRKSGEDEHEL